MFLLMFFLSQLALMAAMLLNSPFNIFVDAVSFFIVLIPAFAMSVGAHGIQNILKIFWEHSATPSLEESKNLADVASSCGRNFLNFGWLGLLIGAVIVFRLQENADNLGAAAGIMLLPLFYGVSVNSMVFGPLTDKYIRLSLELSVEQ